MSATEHRTVSGVPAEDLAAALSTAAWKKMESDVLLSGLLAPEAHARTRSEATGRSVLHWLLARLQMTERALNDAAPMGAAAALTRANHTVAGVSAYLDELALLHPAVGRCDICGTDHCQSSRLIARARLLCQEG